MANDQHLDILKQGVTTWNEWRAANLGINPELQEADLHKGHFPEGNLSNTNLFGANLVDADLSRADLHEANLCRAALHGIKLSGANLHKTFLFGADLSKADLTGANLSNADLSRANLAKANLKGADLSRANLSETVLSQADLSDANLRSANLNRSTLVQTNLENAILSGCHIYGISAWDINLTRTQQTDLIITQKNEPVVTVDNLEVAQFIYLLLHNEKLRDVISTIANKAVLILGRFTDDKRKEILDALRTKLREAGLIPIIFDFEKATERDFTETIKLLAGMSLFVIADITAPRSIPLELQATVPDYMVPFVPILQEGEPAFSMFVNLQNKYPWVLVLCQKEMFG